MEDNKQKSQIYFRLAKQGDAKKIANLHYHVRDVYSEGIFAKFNRLFLNTYYRISIKDKHKFIVLAENESGEIKGFHSISLDAYKSMSFLKKHKFCLAISALPSIIAKPSLLKSLFARYKSIGNTPTDKNSFIHLEGAREEYWAWDNKNKDSESSIELRRTSLNICRALGVEELYGEVDTINKKVYRFQILNGSQIIQTIKLGDGRERAIIKLNLNQSKI